MLSPHSALPSTALLLLLENLLRGLPVIDAGRISRLCRVDLGVGGVVGADRAVAVTDAGRIIYFRLLDLGVVGLGACFFRDF